MLAMVGLAGCGMLAPRPAPLVDWQQGFRLARVAALYTADTPPDSLPACLRVLPEEQLRSRHFAAVSYRSMRARWTVVAAVPPFAPGLALGDRVEVLPAACKAGKLATITRLIPEQAQ